MYKGLCYNNYMQEIIVGKTYQHYKGNLYKILALARHSETGEEMIVYQNTEKGDIWVRPKHMWNEMVDVNGEKVLRFKQL